MRNVMVALWKDDSGALLAMEYLFVATILVIGVIVGLTGLRSAINTELTELGNAILALNGGTGTLTPPTATDPAAPSNIDVPACSQ